MSKLNICEKGSFYICHRCFTFKSNSQNDMKRHYERTTICSPNIISNIDYNNEYFYNKTISSRYVTEMNIKYLKDQHIQIIVDNFTNEYNIITYDLFNSKVKNDNFKLIKNDNNKNNNFDNIINIKNITKKDNNINNKNFTCINCLSEFSSLQKLNIHSQNINFCNKKKQLNELKNKSNNAEILKTKINNTFSNIESEELNKLTQNIFNNIQNQNNIQTQNNIQNINNNNIQNINNQSNNNNISLSTRDFLYDNYDYSHLDINNLKDNFFEYPNFLKSLLKNEVNQNLYFTNNGYTIYYSDNVLNKSQSEMTVCMIINKLKSTFESILENYDGTDKTELIHLKKYYTKLDGQYKNNCYYQNYDFKEKRFYNTAIKNRIRDKLIKDTQRIYDIYLDQTKSKFLNSELYKDQIYHNKLKFDYYLTQKDINKDMFLD